MKPFKTKTLLLAAAAGSLFAFTQAKAQNTHYAPGDLVLYFQQEGSSNTVYVNLGNTATVFRGAAAGADASSILNIVNISSQLNSAFGANWASATNLYAGLAGVWGTSNTLSTLQNGDPQRTLYVSQSRTGVGTVGTANSTGYDLSLSGNTAMTTGAQQMAAQNNAFETNYDAQAVVSPTSVSQIDDKNPFVQPGIQGDAFNIFSGGVQQVGSATSFGTFGDAGNVEFALDLYRILARNNIGGQVGGTNYVGSYEGTVTIDGSGNVSFITVPEPSTTLLMGVGAAMTLFGMRRRRAVNA